MPSCVFGKCKKNSSKVKKDEEVTYHTDDISAMDFTNKVVLVTGASAGIGEATAYLFAKYGAKLSLVGRNEKCLREVADKCKRERGNKPLAIVADLGTNDGVERTAKETLKHFGRLDILINNAAVGAVGLIQNADMKTFDQVFNINVRGVYNLTRLLVPALVQSKGNIVNISSVAGTSNIVGFLPYNMTKATIDHFSRLIALELAPKGVRVNTVSPGATVTKFPTRLPGYVESQTEGQLEQMKDIIPLRKLCQPEDIAHTIVFLASENSELVTGTNVQVDGGANLAGGGIFSVPTS